MQQLKTTSFQQLKVLQVRSLSTTMRCGWIFCLGYHKAEIEVLAQLSLQHNALGKILLLSSFRCWQNSIRCGCKMETPVSLLIVTCGAPLSFQRPPTFFAIWFPPSPSQQQPIASFSCCRFEFSHFLTSRYRIKGLF